MAFAALVLPAAQPKPGAALQAPEHAGEVRPAALPYTPAGQGLQLDAPAKEKVPGRHLAHVALEAAPMAALAVPAGHCMALMELKGQNAPAGHITGTPEAQ